MAAVVTLFLVLALALVLGWHLILPVMGGIIAITAAAWGVLVSSVIILCVAILLIFVFTGTGIFVLGIIAFVWTLLAIILFPILLPVIAPIFLIFLFISYLMRKRKTKECLEKPKIWDEKNK